MRRPTAPTGRASTRFERVHRAQYNKVCCPTQQSALPYTTKCAARFNTVRYGERVCVLVDGALDVDARRTDRETVRLAVTAVGVVMPLAAQLETAYRTKKECWSMHFLLRPQDHFHRATAQRVAYPGCTGKRTHVLEGSVPCHVQPRYRTPSST